MRRVASPRKARRAWLHLRTHRHVRLARGADVVVLCQPRRWWPVARTLRAYLSRGGGPYLEVTAAQLRAACEDGSFSDELRG